MKSNPVAVSDADAVPVPTDGLEFGGFLARNDGLSILRSHSPPNTISSSTLDKQLAGAPPPNITSEYAGSQVKSFKLTSLYLSCAVTSAVSLGEPQPCRLKFTGVNTKGVTVSQTCAYSETAINPALAFCAFTDAFNDIVFVSVAVANSLTLPPTTVLYLDDVNHTNH